MSKPVKRVLFSRLISALVIVALLATLARLIYYAIYWGDMAKRALE